MKKLKLNGSLSGPAKVILVILPIVAVIAALCIGRMTVTPQNVLKALFGGADSQTAIVINTIRLPRVILAALVGAGLSVAGCAFQSLFSNPLATPDTLGVASGASFGAALAILFGFGLVGIQFTALVLGCIAVACTYLAGSGRGRGLSTVVLSGIMIGSLFSGLVSFVKFVANSDTQLPAITYFLLGSLSGAGFRSLAFGSPLIIVGILVLWAIRWRLNILPLSEDEAGSSGTNIKLLRIITVICATSITASCVSMCGLVGWVGLLVPHICRMRFGSNHLSLIPASVSIGATFMIAVDTVARSAFASEIPISVLTAIIGAPFFIFLMHKSRGWQL